MSDPSQVFQWFIEMQASEWSLLEAVVGSIIAVIRSDIVSKVECKNSRQRRMDAAGHRRFYSAS
jgi:hypothetical protein